MTTPFGWPVIIHGDPVGAVIDILRNADDVTDLVPDTNISSDLKGYQAQSPWIEVVSGGGWRARLKIYKPRVDVYCYHPIRSRCWDIAQAAESTLIASIGYAGKGLFLSDIRSESGITEIPDRLQESNRQYFALRLTVTPRP